MGESTTTNPSTGTGGSGAGGGSGGDGGGDFVPIGVWVCNWADIFPWLAMGYYHSIDDTTEAEIMVKVRMMAQDFVTLNRLYRYAANLKLLIPEDPAFKDGDGKMCGQIADSFANAYGSLAAANPVGPAGYKSAAAKAHNDFLGKEAKKIYEIWDRTPCLRSAELGLGYITADKFELYPGGRMVKKEGGRSLKTRGQFNVGGGGDSVQWVPLEEISYYDLGQCTFDGSNFSAFAQFYKVLPLILPQSGKIIAFGEGGFIGSGSMTKWSVVWTVRENVDLSGGSIFCMRCGQREFRAGAHRGVDPLMVRTDTQPVNFVDKGNYLESTDRSIKLYPIPLSAASNINWTGQSFSTNVKADAVLNQRLEEIVKDLESSKVEWSWSSGTLKSEWNGEDPYFREALHKQYFGLAKDPSRKGTKFKPD
jgi:hypothetical protein